MSSRYAKLRVIPGETPPRKSGLLHQSIRYSAELSLVRGAAKELVSVYVANITGAQASQLVKLLGRVAPLGDLDHLKRVRKHLLPASQLQVIICPTAKHSATPHTTQPTQSAQLGRTHSAEQTLLPHPGMGDQLPALQTKIVQQDITALGQPRTLLSTPGQQLSSKAEPRSSSPAAVPSGLSSPAPASCNAVESHASNSAAAADDDADDDDDVEQQQQQSALLGQLPETVSAVVMQHKLQVEVVKVPKHAPASREQWKDWNQIWPISWRKPELTAVTAASAAAEAVTCEEEQQMQQWMDRAVALAGANESSGGVCNAAVIVNPASGEVIAEGQDGTSQHPLSHALMVAIDAAAARDRHLWPNNSQTTSNASAALLAGVDPLLPVPAASSSAELDMDLPAKRQRTSIAGSIHVGMQQGHPLTATHQAVSPDMRRSHSASAEPGQDADISAPLKSYLCTGFDCYVVQEPCAMCAMAATHARLRRVCYSIVDPQQGVLGGALKLHGQTSLNHHYQVFLLPLLP